MEEEIVDQLQCNMERLFLNICHRNKPSLSGLERISGYSKMRKLNSQPKAALRNTLTEKESCLYCGINDVNCLVKCVKTGKWLCNAKNKGKKSHVLIHLLAISANQIELHPKSSKSTKIMCLECNNQNVFALTYFPDSSKILCRYDCGETENKLYKRFPLIFQQEIHRSIVGVPKNDEQAKTFKIPLKNMVRLSVESSPGLINNNMDNKIVTTLIKLNYESRQEYIDAYKRMVYTMKDDQLISEPHIRLSHIRVRNDYSKHKNRVFCRITLEEFDKISTRKLLTISYKEDFFTGSVKKYHSRRRELEVILQEEVPFDEEYCNIEFETNSAGYGRMISSLDIKTLNHFPLEFFLPKKDRESNKENICHEEIKLVCQVSKGLNESQKTVIKSILAGRQLTLIKGPPGTGKTTTIAALVSELYEKKKERILVVAPSNKATDNLCAKILLKSELEVARLCSSQYEPEDKKLLKISVIPGKNKSKGQRKKVIAFLKRAAVICSTCCMSGNSILDELHFQAVIIDESTQAIEPELLISLVKLPKYVILVGDNCQLGPTVTSETAKKQGVLMSLFERLIYAGMEPFILETQYRMHPCIAEFPNRIFYENKLVNDPSIMKGFRRINFPWPDPEQPTFFLAVEGTEEYSESGNSFINDLETKKVIEILEKLIKEGVSPCDIGIITPYNGQRKHLQEALEIKFSKIFEDHVHSVDSIQGSERDFIIFTCVRSNKSKDVGFLKNPRRLNVALTRAKYGLILLGSTSTLIEIPIWKELLCSYQTKGLLVEGELENLKPCEQQIDPLPEPFKYIPGSDLEQIIPNFQETDHPPAL